MGTTATRNAPQTEREHERRGTCEREHNQNKEDKQRKAPHAQPRAQAQARLRALARAACRHTIATAEAKDMRNCAQAHTWASALRNTSRTAPAHEPRAPHYAHTHTHTTANTSTSASLITPERDPVSVGFLHTHLLFRQSFGFLFVNRGSSLRTLNGVNSQTSESSVAAQAHKEATILPAANKEPQLR